MLDKRRSSAANKCSGPRPKASLARSLIADYDVIDDDDFYDWRPQEATPTRPNWFNDRQKVGYLATPCSRYVFWGKPPTRTVLGVDRLAPPCESTTPLGNKAQRNGSSDTSPVW